MTQVRRRPMTLTQKILADHAIGPSRPWVEAGDVLQIRVDWTIASELAWNGMERSYELLGRPPPHDPARVLLAVDHTVDDVTVVSDERTRRLVERSRSFAKEGRLRHFYDANTTIMHTKFYRDLVQPGQVVIGADSHTSSHGGLGAFAIGLGGADVTVAMCLGRSWIEVPPAVAVTFVGAPPFGVGGKDVILKTLGDLKRNTVALERSVEYRGDAVHGWSAETRFIIANMTTELGGLNGIFEPDAEIASHLARRIEENDGASWFRADDDAPYEAVYSVDLTRLGPLVAMPFSPDNVAPVARVRGTPLDGLFIGSCTTTEEELVLGALVLEQAWTGRTAHAASPKRLVVPGDRTIAARMRDAGLWAAYEKAGFRIGPPGCSMCLGVASERALPGETWLSSQNRNFENRMGPGSRAWLASCATVAASSLDMRIEDPRRHLEAVDRERFDRILGRAAGKKVPEVRTREPDAGAGQGTSTRASTPRVGGRTMRSRVQRFGDHVDTDAIIPAEFCHLTRVEEVGEKAFHFVRPEFVERARHGRTFVVAREGWGCGSSREHAAWALLGAGITCVIAKSFGFIHKRNLVNEALAFLCVRDPEFHALVQEDDELDVDLGSCTVTHLATRRAFRAESPGTLAAAIQTAGGLVAAVKGGLFDELPGPATHRAVPRTREGGGREPE